jgi:arginyl-tRNA synthetase
MHLSPARERIAEAVTEAVRDLGVEQVPDLELGRARSGSHGDYATPVAMKLGRSLGQPPPAIACRLAERIEIEEATVESSGPYLNFRLRPRWLGQILNLAAADQRYGASDMGAGQSLQVEFVSTNPTGPLHIGHGRGAILGDSMCRILEFTGHRVQREYYVNDYGTQARKFGESLYARLMGDEPPPGGYVGDYVNDLVEEARRQIPALESMPAGEATAALREFGTARIVEQFKQTLSRLNVRYDEWYSEKRLWELGLPQAAIDRLQQSGYLKEREGAVWFTAGSDEDDAAAINQDEDRVVIRSDGLHTYFASDLGYLLSRFEARGYERVIEVWGADHHGYVPRMKQAAAALGLDPKRLVIILNQMVNLKEGKMSKRQGRFVTLDELVDRVGVDAVRYFYLLRSPDTMMEFDLQLAVSEGNENPVYYAQYAHARLSSVERHAAQIHPRLPESPNLALLDKPWELAVARELAFWPDTVETASALLEPHRLPYYVHELADKVHAFYHAGNDEPGHRIVLEDPDLTRARIELCRAARNTLRIALGLMGVSAPNEM